MRKLGKKSEEKPKNENEKNKEFKIYFKIT
jgi:hypothetical protein